MLGRSEPVVCRTGANMHTGHLPADLHNLRRWQRHSEEVLLLTEGARKFSEDLSILLTHPQVYIGRILGLVDNLFKTFQHSGVRRVIVAWGSLCRILSLHEGRADSARSHRKLTWRALPTKESSEHRGPF